MDVRRCFELGVMSAAMSVQLYVRLRTGAHGMSFMAVVGLRAVL